MNFNHRISIIVFFLLCNCYVSHAGWVLKTNFAGLARFDAFSFAYGNKGYVGGGLSVNNNLYDLWEYDSQSNSWSQKADFPDTTGLIRHTSFTIGTKGFVAGGMSPASVLLSDNLWEYDMIQNTWIQKTSFPGGGRIDHSSFVIGNFAYVGLGIKLVGFSFAPQKDFLRYDSMTDSWIQSTNIIGQERSVAAAFAINGFGYIIGGSGPSGHLFELQQFNPSTNMWTLKQPNPNLIPNCRGIGFNGSGYVTGGFASPYASSTVYKYSPASNTWSADSNMIYGRGKNSLFVLQDTLYSVCGYVDVLNTGSTTTQAYSIGSAVGFEEHTSMNQQIIYPSACRGTLYVSGKFLEAQKFNHDKLSFISIDGKVVKISSLKNVIDVSDLSNGIYFVRSDSGIINMKFSLIK